uniref:Uncharacterized protein n=1 Tax=Spironucleus salmonicida TaxID=348837 RepID=V6LPT5_9EUKA|eukprot:EST42764.1 Hypothetical protein SS50377_17631 [Spironucleus salmonicida]
MQICYVSEWTPGPELHEGSTRTGISAVYREGLGAGNLNMQVHRNNTSRTRTLHGSNPALGALTTPNDVKKQVRFPASLVYSYKHIQVIPVNGVIGPGNHQEVGLGRAAVLLLPTLTSGWLQPRYQLGSVLGVAKYGNNRVQQQVFQAKI